jgi:hypothetical protein
MASTDVEVPVEHVEAPVVVEPVAEPAPVAVDETPKAEEHNAEAPVEHDAPVAKEEHTAPAATEHVEAPAVAEAPVEATADELTNDDAHTEAPHSEHAEASKAEDPIAAVEALESDTTAATPAASPLEQLYTPEEKELLNNISGEDHTVTDVATTEAAKEGEAPA